MFECYLITYSDEQAEANTYYAVLAKKIYPTGNDYYLVTDKKDEDNDKLNMNREENKENEFKNDNISKTFVPKFETMNDKPKPKKGNFLKSYNDEY